MTTMQTKHGMRLAAAALCAGLALGGAEAADVTDRRMTWAHYVPWLTPENVSMDPNRWVNAPVYERGTDPLREEVLRAQAAGLDGFFMDIVCYDKSMAFWDLRPFLKAAEGTDFQFAVCLDRKVAPETCVSQLVQMLSTYGNHPNYPKVGGRHVVNAYTCLARTPEEWRAVTDGCREAGYPIYVVANVETYFEPYDEKRLLPYADVFDMLYFFSLTGNGGISSEEENRRIAGFCKTRGRRFMPCLHPGYFGAWIRGRNDCYQTFRGVDRLHDHFLSAVSLGPDATWLHVTTWNDHDETTLQPRRLTPADGLLVRAYSDAFRGKAPPERPEVVFAYHREELPGTVIRFEALRLAAKAKGKTSVGLRLLGPDGTVVAAPGPKVLADDWSRCEWRVPSAALSGLTHLVPEVVVSLAGETRRGTLQPVLLRTPWLEHPETIKTALAFRRDDIAADWRLSQTGDVLTASVSFRSPVAVRRAVLYRNDRPLGQFMREPSKDPLLTVAYSGQSFMRLSTQGGRLVSVLKHGETNGSPNFAWNAQKADSKLTPGWMRFTALIEAPTGAVVRLDGCNWRKAVSGTPGEIARRRILTAGPVVLSHSPDCTLRDRPALDCRDGSLTLRLYAREPSASDAYWIAFECADGTVCETPIRMPYAQGTVRAPIVETAVTLEKSTGATGRPDRCEWLDGTNGLPMTAVRDVDLARGSCRRAHWSFEGDGVDTAGDRPIVGLPETAFAEGFAGRGLRLDGARRFALPARLWPAGAWRISVRLKPDAWDGERRVVLGKRGWHEGVTLALDGAGRPEAVLSGGEKTPGEYSFVARADRPLATGKWQLVELVCNARTLRLLVDGAERAAAVLDPRRQYGNLTAWIGAADPSEKSYRGFLDELDVASLAR